MTRAAILAALLLLATAGATPAAPRPAHQPEAVGASAGGQSGAPTGVSIASGGTLPGLGSTPSAGNGAPTSSPALPADAITPGASKGPVPDEPMRAPITGIASWYCGHGSPCTAGYPAGSMAGAAGPALRHLRGSLVAVCVPSGPCVRVRLVDACECLAGARLVDLYASVWHALELDLGRGLVTVGIAS